MCYFYINCSSLKYSHWNDLPYFFVRYIVDGVFVEYVEGGGVGGIFSTWSGGLEGPGNWKGRIRSWAWREGCPSRLY